MAPRALPTIRKNRTVPTAPCYVPAMVDEPAAPKKRGRPRKPETEKAPRESKPMGRPPKDGEAMRTQMTVSLSPRQFAAVNAELHARLQAWCQDGPVPTRGDIVRDALDAWFAAK